MIGETFQGQSMFENLHKISLIPIEKAPVTQPNIYSLERSLKKASLAPAVHCKNVVYGEPFPITETRVRVHTGKCIFQKSH